MCDTHGTHVTSIKGVLRCVLCGRCVESGKKIRLRDIPSEIWHRHVARERLWRTPKVSGGILYY